VRSREFYEGLGLISRTALGDGLLENGALDEHRLAFYHALSRMDPLIASMRGALGDSAYHAEELIVSSPSSALTVCSMTRNFVYQQERAWLL
jgi:hypothetical protein